MGIVVDPPTLPYPERRATRRHIDEGAGHASAFTTPATRKAASPRSCVRRHLMLTRPPFTLPRQSEPFRVACDVLQPWRSIAPLMSQTDLIARIAALDPPSPAAWFALLCTYYTPMRLKEAENRLVAKGIRPLRVAEVPFGGLGHEELRTSLATLHGHFSSPSAVDEYALGMLKVLDRTLFDLTPSLFDAESVAGFDDRRYRVRQLQNPIAVHAGRGLPPEARQGTLSAYRHRMAIVPVDEVDQGRIECLRVESFAPPVYKRLLAARDDLSIALCPLQGRIDYPGLDTYCMEPRPDFVVLKEPRNEGDLMGQLASAIDTASAERATMLIFPELALSPAMLAAAQARLAAHGAGGHPILTVAGLCHAPHGSDGSHLNEAVVLGPDGQELHRHRKLSRFTDTKDTPERILTGSTLGVLETPCGNLATPICLDVFAKASQALLFASHATLLLVPSLSEKLSAHRDASRAFATDRWGSTFVCNRTFAGFNDDARSFYWTPFPDTPHEHDGSKPQLWFRLS
jgi:hypothetical protein